MANFLLAQLVRKPVVSANAHQPTISLLEVKRGGELVYIQLCMARPFLTSRLSYVAALELRIEKLEKRLQFAKSRKASVALHENDSISMSVQQMDRRDSLAAIRAAIHRKAARKREISDVNSLVSDFGFL